MTTAGRRGVRGAGGGGPAPFLMKTHEMVEEEMSDDVISWSEKGTSFVVWKPVEFARDILPANFKHNNFSSFVRQLNTYGFRKVVPDRWEFANEYFRRGDCSLLSKIHRRKSAASPATKPTNPLSSASYNSGEAPSSSSTSSLPPPPPPSADVLELSNENKKLKKHNQILSSELAQAKLHCQELLAFLSNHAGDGELDVGLLFKEAAMHGVKIAGEKEKGIEQKGEKECLKLFGVCLEVFGGRQKRGRCEESGGSGCGGRRHIASAAGGVFC